MTSSPLSSDSGADSGSGRGGITVPLWELAIVVGAATGSLDCSLDGAVASRSEGLVHSVLFSGLTGLEHWQDKAVHKTVSKQLAFANCVIDHVSILIADAYPIHTNDT